MATINALRISGSWTDLNFISGIAIGFELIIQNLGRAGDIVEIAISEIQPTESYRGIALEQIRKSYRVTPSARVWVRYIRYDLTQTIIPQPSRLCGISVQVNSEIQDSSDIPYGLITASNRIKTSSESSLDTAAKDGLMFSFSHSITIPANDQQVIGAKYSGATAVRRVCAKGLGISYVIGEALGNVISLGSAQNLLFSAPDSYQALFRVTDDGYNGSVKVSGYDCIDTPVYPGGGNLFVFSNDTGSPIKANVSIILESTGGFQVPFGLSGSTQLTATTEMINYAPN